MEWASFLNLDNLSDGPATIFYCVTYRTWYSNFSWVFIFVCRWACGCAFQVLSFPYLISNSSLCFCFVPSFALLWQPPSYKVLLFSATYTSAPPNVIKYLHKISLMSVFNSVGFCFFWVFFPFFPSSTLFQYAWEASQRADGGLVGRIALSLSLYYALPYWFYTQ